MCCIAKNMNLARIISLCVYAIAVVSGCGSPAPNGDMSNDRVVNQTRNTTFYCAHGHIRHYNAAKQGDEKDSLAALCPTALCAHGTEGASDPFEATSITQAIAQGCHLNTLGFACTTSNKIETQHGSQIHSRCPIGVGCRGEGFGFVGQASSVGEFLVEACNPPGEDAEPRAYCDRGGVFVTQPGVGETGEPPAWRFVGMCPSKYCAARDGEIATSDEQQLAELCAPENKPLPLYAAPAVGEATYNCSRGKIRRYDRSKGTLENVASCPSAICRWRPKYYGSRTFPFQAASVTDAIREGCSFDELLQYTCEWDRGVNLTIRGEGDAHDYPDSGRVRGVCPLREATECGIERTKAGSVGEALAEICQIHEDLRGDSRYPLFVCRFGSVLKRRDDNSGWMHLAHCDTLYCSDELDELPDGTSDEDAIKGLCAAPDVSISGGSSPNFLGTERPQPF